MPADGDEYLVADFLFASRAACHLELDSQDTGTEKTGKRTTKTNAWDLGGEETEKLPELDERSFHFFCVFTETNAFFVAVFFGAVVGLLCLWTHLLLISKCG